MAWSDLTDTEKAQVKEFTRNYRCAVATVWPDRETVESYGVQLAGPGNVG